MLRGCWRERGERKGEEVKDLRGKEEERGEKRRRRGEEKKKERSDLSMTQYWVGKGMSSFDGIFCARSKHTPSSSCAETDGGRESERRRRRERDRERDAMTRRV